MSRNWYGIRWYGPVLPDLREGWAVVPIPWTEVAHYWRHVEDQVHPVGRVRVLRSLCQVVRTTHGLNQAHQRGDVPRCLRCMARRRVSRRRAA